MHEITGISMFNRIANWFGKVFRRSTTSWVYRMPVVFSRFPVSSGATVNEDTAISWTAIWRGLQLVGAAIGSMPFTVIEEDDNGNIRTLKGHPLYPIINLEPHPFYSTFDFLQAIIYQVLLRGNAVIVINRRGRAGGANRPESFRIVEYDDVLNIKETDEGLLIYTIKGYPEAIQHWDIIHIKGLTRCGLSGLDPLQWHRETIGLALASQETAAKSYRQGTHSDGFLSTETQLDIETRKDLQGAWNSQVQNGETPLLTGGVKWNQISVTPKDIQLLEGRQFNVYEAARLLGISPHLLFAMDRANFSNVETMSLEFSKFTLRFLVERIEQEFNRKIFRGSERGRVKVNLNMDAFLRGDTEARANYLQTLIDRGVLTIDEARKIEGFNPHPGNAGKTAMVPMNFQTLDQMNAGGLAPKDPPNDERTKLNGQHKILN